VLQTHKITQFVSLALVKNANMVKIVILINLLEIEGDEECLRDVPTFTSADRQGDPIANEWYDDAPDILTPYILLNLKNHVAGGLAYFVVLARNESDISKAVLFATAHDIAVSVMSTGHEFQVRGRTLMTSSLPCIRMNNTLQKLALEPNMSTPCQPIMNFRFGEVY
jgi:hypothetical protein